MYEQQTPFELSDYVGLSYFLNNFLHKAIQENYFGTTHADRLRRGGEFGTNENILKYSVVACFV